MNNLKFNFICFILSGLFFFRSTYAQTLVIDTAFGDNGVVVTNARNALNNLIDMVVLPDDKILIAGSLRPVGNRQVNIVKYNADGSIDTTYGSGGMNWSSFGGDVALTGIAVEPDGKIVAAGTRFQSSNTDILLVRYTDKGSFDMSMNNFSSVKTELPSLNSEVQAMSLLDDGKILVAGITETTNNQFDLFLTRYTYFGIVDSTFGTNGFIFEPVGGSASKIARIIELSDGKILLGGNNSSNWLVNRYLQNGAPDSTFGTNGKFINTQTIVLDNGASDLKLLSDGKILQFGTSSNGIRTFGLTRYTASGGIDNTFGVNGKVNTSVGDYVMLTCGAVQPDGNILAGGVTMLPPWSFAFARYNENGQLDATINTGSNNTSLIKIAPDTLFNIGKKIGLQQDGKIIVAGNTGDNYALVRYKLATTTSINANNFLDDIINLYPNPATSHLRIDLGRIYSKLTLEVHNINGQLMERKRMQNIQQHVLNVSKWSKGLYVISVISEEGAINGKFIKQ